MSCRWNVQGALGVLLWAAVASIVLAQAQAGAQNLPPPGAYQPIPNFTGVGAGLQFRKAINDRLSGVLPVAPSITSITFTNLPTEQDGSIVLCKDCKRTTPCTSGGAGAWALGARGGWSCSTDSLEANLNANGNKVVNLANATVGGDALGFGQSAGGDLAGALPNPNVQTVLNGKTPIFSGQVNPQFLTYALPFVVATTVAYPGATSVTINKPAGTAQGDLEIFYVGVQNSSLVVTPPDGSWHAIHLGTSESSISDASYYKIAGASEPSSYTFTLSTGAWGTSGMVTVRQVNQSAPIDASSSFYPTSNVTSVTIGAPAATQSPDLTLILVANTSQPYTSSAPAGTTAQFLASGNSVATAGWTYSTIPSAATVSNGGFSGAWGAQQISIAAATFGPAPAVLNGQTAATLVAASLSGTTTLASATLSGAMTGSSSSASISAVSVNGVYNVQQSGAVGDGVTHADAAIQAAIDNACSAPNSPPATVYFPTPTNFYDTCNPIFVHCSGIRLVGPSSGSSAHTTLLQDNGCPAGPIFVLQGYGMSGVTLGAPLISGSTHSASFNGTTHYSVNLNDIGTGISVDGLTGFTQEAYVKLNAVTDGFIGSSAGRRTSSSVGTNSYALRINGGQFTGCLTVSGSQFCLTDTTTVLAANTLYHVAMSYDGTTIRLFTNGALVASAVHAGTVTDPWWEVAQVGNLNQGDWPDGVTANPINGLIDGYRISKTARWTAAFTPCNCEPTNDSNTVVIASFDKNLHMLTQLQWQDVDSRSGWSYVRRLNEDNGANEPGVLGVEMDDISAAGSKGSVGIVGQQINGGHFRHSTFINVASGIYLYQNDFENVFEDITVQQGSGGYIGILNGPQSGLNLWIGGQIVGFMTGVRVEDSGVIMVGPTVQQQTNSVWGYNIEGDNGFAYFTCLGCGADVEGGGPWLGGMLLDSIENASIDGGAFASANSSPCVEVSGGGSAGGTTATFTSTQFSPSGAPEVVHVSNPSGANVVLLNPYEGAAVRWTDSPSSVSVLKSNYSIPASTAFANLGTVFTTNGQNGFCNDCDPPSNPPVACTSSGAKTGAMVTRINGANICHY